jgi:hypothetical protein
MANDREQRNSETSVSYERVGNDIVTVYTMGDLESATKAYDDNDVALSSPTS